MRPSLHASVFVLSVTLLVAGCSWSPTPVSPKATLPYRQQILKKKQELRRVQQVVDSLRSENEELSRERTRLERRLADGSIRVFFDNMSEPVMVAENQRFDWGMVGVGSFDDVGRIRNLVVRGAESRPRGAAPFASVEGK